MKPRKLWAWGGLLIWAAMFIFVRTGEDTAVRASSTDTVFTTVPPDIPPEYQMRFTHLSIEDGLSHGMVLRIVQDDLGFMWFGTGNGLNRYDGHTFKIYKYDPDDPHSLQSNSIWALYADRSGTLWVGTEGGGLNQFDRDTDRFIHYLNDPHDPHSLSHNGVTVIYEDRDGLLWVGTAAGGLNRFDRGTGQFTQYRHDPADPHSLSNDGVISLLQDQEGALWVGTADGLN
ncbi:MAG TPA: hypothetical protein ENN99_08645, partial [Chloroflexi bacterium]|nr:hypothetical protein [Chloroflexota bacterium]